MYVMPKKSFNRRLAGFFSVIVLFTLFISLFSITFALPEITSDTSLLDSAPNQSAASKELSSDPSFDYSRSDSPLSGLTSENPESSSVKAPSASQEKNSPEYATPMQNNNEKVNSSKPKLDKSISTQNIHSQKKLIQDGKDKSSQINSKSIEATSGALGETPSYNTQTTNSNEINAISNQTNPIRSILYLLLLAIALAGAGIAINKIGPSSKSPISFAAYTNDKNQAGNCASTSNSNSVPNSSGTLIRNSEPNNNYSSLSNNQNNSGGSGDGDASNDPRIKTIITALRKNGYSDVADAISKASISYDSSKTPGNIEGLGTVGGHQIWLDPELRNADTKTFAEVLIHESIHNLGKHDDVAYPLGSDIANKISGDL